MKTPNAKNRPPRSYGPLYELINTAVLHCSAPDHQVSAIIQRFCRAEGWSVMQALPLRVIEREQENRHNTSGLTDFVEAG